MQMQKLTPPAGLTVDMKRYRIRIPGRTFRIINNPDYFRFLVNPEAKGIVIERCNEKDKGAYQLSKVPTHKGSYELTSVRLITEIIHCAGFSGTASIRLAGQQIRGQDALFFRMEQSEQHDRSGQSE